MEDQTVTRTLSKGETFPHTDEKTGEEYLVTVLGLESDGWPRDSDTPAGDVHLLTYNGARYYVRRNRHVWPQED